MMTLNTTGLRLAALLGGLMMMTNFALWSAAQAGDAMMTMGAWARPSIGAKGNSAAYFKIMNHSDKADRIVGAKADVSRLVQIHTHIMDGDIMRMRRVEGGVDVPAGGTVEFKPGSFHIMLIDLKSKLAENDTFPLTLVFESGSEVKVDVKVQKKPSGEVDGEHDHN